MGKRFSTLKSNFRGKKGCKVERGKPTDCGEVEVVILHWEWKRLERLRHGRSVAVRAHIPSALSLAGIASSSLPGFDFPPSGVPNNATMV
jgi:hypothetical protein